MQDDVVGLRPSASGWALGWRPRRRQSHVQTVRRPDGMHAHARRTWAQAHPGHRRAQALGARLPLQLPFRSAPKKAAASRLTGLLGGGRDNTAMWVAVRPLQPVAAAPVIGPPAGGGGGAVATAALGAASRDHTCGPGALSTPSIDCRRARAGANSGGVPRARPTGAREHASAFAPCATAPARRFERSACTGCSRRTACLRRT